MREINRKAAAAKNSKSEYLKRDYKKSVRRDLADLRFYCQNHGLDFKEVVRRAS